MTQPDKSAINELNELVEMLPWLKDFQQHWQAGTAITGDGVVCKAEPPAAERQETTSHKPCKRCGNWIYESLNEEGICPACEKQLSERQEQPAVRKIDAVMEAVHGITEPPAAPQPLSVEEARQRGVCRICGRTTLYLSTGVNFGEQAHVACLDRERAAAEPNCAVACQAAKADGIICPDDSCDIEDGVRAAAEPQKIVSVVLPNAEALCAAGQKVMQEMATEPPSEGETKQVVKLSTIIAELNEDVEASKAMRRVGAKLGLMLNEYYRRAEQAERQRDEARRQLAAEKRRGEQEVREAQNAGNGLYAEIIKRLKPLLGDKSRDLDWDVLPSTIGGLAKENAELKQQLAAEQLGPMGVLHGKNISGWWEEATRLQADNERLRERIEEMHESNAKAAKWNEQADDGYRREIERLRAAVAARDAELRLLPMPADELRDGHVLHIDAGTVRRCKAATADDAGDEIAAELERLRKENECFKEGLEPGKANAIINGMFELAHRYGHPRHSARHALIFLKQQMAASKERIEALTEGVKEIRRYMLEHYATDHPCFEIAERLLAAPQTKEKP
jgi:ribosomal protein L37E